MSNDAAHNNRRPRPEDVLIEALLEAHGQKSGIVYEFDCFRLDVAEHRLLRDGVPIRLAPREFETLHLLVERHGQLVSKRELLDRVWGGLFVSDNTIAQRIATLRRALEDRPRKRFIETVPKRGYRFVADVGIAR